MKTPWLTNPTINSQTKTPILMLHAPPLIGADMVQTKDLDYNDDTGRKENDMNWTQYRELQESKQQTEQTNEQNRKKQNKKKPRPKHKTEAPIKLVNNDPFLCAFADRLHTKRAAVTTITDLLLTIYYYYNISINRATYINYESAEAEMPLTLLYPIATLLNTTPADLVPTEDEVRTFRQLINEANRKEENK